MKTIIFCATLIFFSFLPQITFGQSDCHRFKNGKFFLPDHKGEEYLIERKGKVQTETESTGLKMKFKVEWINDCTYTLRFKKMLSNPENIKISKDWVVRVEIIETKENSYIQRSFIDGTGLVEESEMTMVSD